MVKDVEYYTQTHKGVAVLKIIYVELPQRVRYIVLEDDNIMLVNTCEYAAN